VAGVAAALPVTAQPALAVALMVLLVVGQIQVVLEHKVQVARGEIHKVVPLTDRLCKVVNLDQLVIVAAAAEVEVVTGEAGQGLMVILLQVIPVVVEDQPTTNQQVLLRQH
jgi:hypothetical protein